MARDIAALGIANTAKIKHLWGTGLNKFLYAVSQARRAGTQINVVCSLDSLTAGAGTPLSSYVDYLRPLLQAQLGDGGLGYLAFNSSAVANEFGGSTSAFGSSGGVQVTNTSFSAGTDTIYDPNLYAMTFAGSGGFINFQDTRRIFTKARVWYLKQPSGGTFKWGDGAFTPGQETVNTADAGGKSLASYMYTGTFPSTKSNAVQVSNIVGPVRLMGSDYRNGSTGVRVHRLGQGGTLADQVAQLDETAYTSFLQTIGCDLFILNAGMNDSGSSIAAADYDTDIRTILTRVRSANPNAAIILMVMNETDNSSRNATLETYRLKLLKIALDFDAVIFDNRWLLGNYATANSRGYMSDGVHPKDTANRLIGEALFNNIGGNYLANIDKVLSS